MDRKRVITYDLADYLRMMRRSWWVLILCIVIGVAAALAYTRHEPKVYQSTTSVQVMPTTLDANATGGRTAGSINLDTQAALVTSLNIAQIARGLLQTTDTPTQLSQQVHVSVPPNSTILNIAYDAGKPDDAAHGSHAFATAYLKYRGDQANLDIQRQITSIQSQIGPLTATYNQTTAKLAVTPSNSADHGALQGTAIRTEKQIETLQGRLSDLNGQVQNPGSIISDAALPTKPIAPVVPINLAGGAVVGLLLGLGIAVIRERTDGLLRRTSDVTRRSDLPVLAELPPRVKPLFSDVYPITGTAGRTFGRLRNEVVASLTEQQRVIVVSGASRGPSSALVAGNLACTFARSGARVVLIGAHVTPRSPLSRIVDVSAVPGLLDVLSGRVPLSDALQRSPRARGLDVLAVGGAASSGGLFQSEAVRGVIDELLSHCDYIVIESPSTSVTSDAQMLASLADACIITVEVRRTRHREINDAASQLGRVCPTVLGVVALPRMEPRGDDRGPIVPATSAPALRPAPMDSPMQPKPESSDDVETRIITALKADTSKGDDNHRNGDETGDAQTVVMQRIGADAVRGDRPKK